MKALEQLEAKLKLLDYLRRHHKVRPEILDAAKQKIGADLADALSGDLGKAVAEKLSADVQRLERGELQAGDNVKWHFGSEERVDQVLRVDARTIVVDIGQPYQMNRGEAAADPETLNQLRDLRDAALTSIGWEAPAPLNIPPGWPMPSMPGQHNGDYEVIDVEA